MEEASNEDTVSHRAASPFDCVCTAAFVGTLLPLFLFLTNNPGSFIFSSVFLSFRFSVLIGAMVGGIALTIFGVTRHSTSELPFSVMSSVFFGSLIGFTPVLLSGLIPVGETVISVAGLIFGICLSLSVLAWSIYRIDVSLNRLLLSVSIYCMAALAFNGLLGLLSSSTAGIVYFLAIMLGALPPLISSYRKRLRLPSYDSSPEAETGGFSFKQQGSIVDLLIVTASSVLGLFLFSALSNTQVYSLEGHSTTITSYGLVGASFIFALVALVFHRRPLVVYSHLVIPLVAGLLIILDSFLLGSTFSKIGAGGVFFFFSFISVFAVAFLLAVIEKAEFSSFIVAGFSVALLTGASMAGWRFALSEPDENSRGAVLLVICTCYFVFVLVAPVIQSWLDIRDKNTGDTRSDGVGAEEYSERCSTISKEYGLSARESEVLYYVGRGYNASYIAKALYISDSTARTHLNNIYHKLDITSRMQAIEMFEGVYDREIIE